MSEIHRDFVNNMAHEFNTPISSIGLAASYFRQQEAMKNIKKSDRYLSIIENENLKLKKQVDEILQLGRYEQYNYQLDIKKCSISDSIEEAFQELKLNYPTSEISYNLDKETDDTVLADSNHLRNIFHNLFENVIKYCPENHSVNIGITKLKNRISVDFKDFGPGIQLKYQKKIFKRFYRVPMSDIQQTKGFGIGLFYVKFILKKMNGKIALTKSDSNGTTFNIQLEK